jgi:hypothetical protein
MLKKTIVYSEINKITIILSKISAYLITAFQDLHYLIINKIPDNYDKMSYLVNKFYIAFGDKSETLFLFIIFMIRGIILFMFVIDVFIYFELKYMYLVLYLLCFSLLIRLWFYLLKDFAGNLETIKENLIIIDLGIDASTQLPITHYNLKEESKHLDLEYHVEQFILCNKISGYLEMYEKYSIFFTPYVNIFIYSTYLIGWLYVIFCNY